MEIEFKFKIVTLRNELGEMQYRAKEKGLFGFWWYVEPHDKFDDPVPLYFSSDLPRNDPRRFLYATTRQELEGRLMRICNRRCRDIESKDYIKQQMSYRVEIEEEVTIKGTSSSG